MPACRALRPGRMIRQNLFSCYQGPETLAGLPAVQCNIMRSTRACSSRYHTRERGCNDYCRSLKARFDLSIAIQRCSFNL